MLIKRPLEFQTFTSGNVDIYTVKNNRPDQLVISMRYGEKVISMKRFYAARAATTDIDLLIQVPQHREITAEHNAVIAGIRYKIEQVQHINDTNPPVTVLTLRKLGVMPDGSTK